MSARVIASIVLLPLAFTGCVKSGADNNSSGAGERATPPIAAPGTDQTVTLGTFATLDGSASTDPTGGSIRYGWSLTQVPAGSSATLADPTAAQTTFLADLPGTYEAHLVVSNGRVWSDPSVFTFMVAAESADSDNLRPTASIRLPPDVSSGMPVTLDGTTSHDPENATLSYAWSLISRPGGSKARIEDPTSATPRLIPDGVGLYDIQLVVRDDRQASVAAVSEVYIDPAEATDPLQNVTYRINPARTNVFEGGTLKTPLRRRWLAEVPKYVSYPLVTKDAVYFVGAADEDGTKADPLLYAYDLATGTRKWDPVPLVVEGTKVYSRTTHISYSLGTIFGTNLNGDIFAIQENDGKVRWSRRGAGSTGAVSDDGFEYFAAPFVSSNRKLIIAGRTAAKGERYENWGTFVFSQDDGQTLAFIPTCRMDANRAALTDVQSGMDLTPSFRHGIAYTGSVCGKVFAINTNDGSLEWASEKFPGICKLDTIVYDTIAADGLIYTSMRETPYVDYCPKDGNYDPDLEAYSPVVGLHGNLIRRQWNAITASAVDGSIAIRYSMTNDDEWLEARNLLDGQLLWYTNGLHNFSWPLDPIVVNGTVYLAQYGKLFAFDEKTGKNIWFDEVDSGTYPTNDIWNNALGTNGEVVALMSNRGLMIFESDPTTAGDDSYKTKCEGPGNQFYIEGTPDSVGPNGVSLENGDRFLQGSATNIEGGKFTVASTNQAGYPGLTHLGVVVQATQPANSTWLLSFDPYGKNLSTGVFPPPDLAETGGKMGFSLWIKENLDSLGCSSGASGSFSGFELEINELEITNNFVQKLSANFVRHCGSASAAVRGCINWKNPTP